MEIGSDQMHQVNQMSTVTQLGAWRSIFVLKWKQILNKSVLWRKIHNHSWLHRYIFYAPYLILCTHFRWWYTHINSATLLFLLVGWMVKVKKIGAADEITWYQWKLLLYRRQAFFLSFPQTQKTWVAPYHPTSLIQFRFPIFIAIWLCSNFEWKANPKGGSWKDAE